MKARQFLYGGLLDLVIGALAAIGLYQLTEAPVRIRLSGVVESDHAATHRDSALDHRCYLRDSIALQGPVYLSAEHPNDLQKFVGKPVVLDGWFDTIPLKEEGG